MLVLTPTQLKVYNFIKEHGYYENCYRALGFKYKQQLSPYLRILLANGYLREQSKYKAVRKENV